MVVIIALVAIIVVMVIIAVWYKKRHSQGNVKGESRTPAFSNPMYSAPAATTTTNETGGYMDVPVENKDWDGTGGYMDVPVGGNDEAGGYMDVPVGGNDDDTAADYAEIGSGSASYTNPAFVAPSVTTKSKPSKGKTNNKSGGSKKNSDKSSDKSGNNSGQYLDFVAPNMDDVDDEDEMDV